MIITFCGHSLFEGNEKLKLKILKTIERVTNSTDATFYLGGYGGFDNFARLCCMEYKKTHPNSKLIFVTPYLNEAYLRFRNEYNYYDEILYPNLETKPLKYAIIERNKWMVKNSNFLISYVTNSWSGAGKTLEFAKKYKTKYINLA